MSDTETPDICGEQLTDEIVCQKPTWHRLVEDHGWHGNGRHITWKTGAKVSAEQKPVKTAADAREWQKGPWVESEGVLG